eukprot:jgi/Botrbrau1/7329/Bobra.247_3s0024.1
MKQATARIFWTNAIWQYTTLHMVSASVNPPPPTTGQPVQPVPSTWQPVQAVPWIGMPNVQCCTLGSGSYLWRPGGAAASRGVRSYNAAAEGRPPDMTYSAAADVRYKTVSSVERSLQSDFAATQTLLLKAGSFLRKAVRLVARTAVVTSVASAVAVFVACDFDDAKTLAAFVSVPRTVAAISWGVKAAGAYRRVLDEYEDHKSPEYLARLSAVHDLMAKKLLQVCQRNGGVYIKAAQHLTTFRGVPPEYITTLEVLQDRVTPRPFPEIERALARELRCPISAVFCEFNPQAKAAASLAQVHKARLHDSGAEVAVKIQYLGLETAVYADLATLQVLARVAAWAFPNAFDFGWVVDSLQANLDQELDFRVEVANADRLAQNLANCRGVAVPAIYHNLSGQRMIVMEWVDGVKLTDEQGLREARIRPRTAGLLLLSAFAHMLLEDGFVHADLHPGNILVRPHPNPRWWKRVLKGRCVEPQLVLLDHGLFVEVPPRLRLNYCRLWVAFLLNDNEAARQAAVALSGDERTADVLPVVLRPGALKAMTKEQRTALRQSAGMNSMANLGRVMEGLPRDLLDVLRVSALVRSQAAILGASPADGLRINAQYAVKGMEMAMTNAGTGVVLTELQKLNISVRIFSLQALYIVVAGWNRLLEAIPWRRRGRLATHVTMAHAWGPAGS